MRSIGTILLLLFFFTASAQKTKKASTSATLFSVNNRPVSADEFIYLYKKNHQNQKEDFTKEKIDEYLNLYINFKLKVEEARSRGIDTTRVFIKEFNQYREELRRPYLPEGKMLDSLVRLTYERLKEEVKAAHLLIGVKPDASPQDTLEAYRKIMDLKSKTFAGEDFSMLASKHSEDPSARQNHGNLGYFTALQMVYPFENAAYTGKPGDVVGPVRTRFGYHLLHIQDRKPARGEVEVSHIMIRTSPDKNEAQARNTIFEVFDQLKGGVPWEELCAQYSEDPSSKNNGGRLRPFGVRAMEAAPEFDQIAFALQQPGEISDPFQTPFGWHIVRLEQKIPLPSFEELAPSLKARVQRDERVQVSKQALADRLKKQYAFKENPAVKSRVFAAADSSLIKGKWSVATWPEKDIFFSLKSKNILAKDFIQYVSANQRTATLPPDTYIQQLYEAFVEAVINQAYEDHLVRTNPNYEMLLREYYEGILLFDIMEKEVWNRASDDTTGQRNYFNTHAANYQAGERASAEIFSGALENISALITSLDQNDSVNVQELIRTRRVRKETGIFQRNDRPALAKTDWQAGTYSLENNGMYYLVRILKIIPPGPMTFEEAKASVISDYQSYLEKNWVDQLKKKYGVKINEKGKQEVLKKLIRS